MTTTPQHGSFIGGAVCLDIETVFAALPIETKEWLAASVFADEAFITRVVDVLTDGVTTDDVGSLYGLTLERLQIRLSEKWPEMAKELIQTLIRRVRYAEEGLERERQYRDQWIAYYRDPSNSERPPTQAPLSMHAVSAGLSAREAEVDRIIAAIRAAEEAASE